MNQYIKYYLKIAALLYNNYGQRAERVSGQVLEFARSQRPQSVGVNLQALESAQLCCSQESALFAQPRPRSRGDARELVHVVRLAAVNGEGHIHNLSRVDVAVWNAQFQAFSGCTV